MKAIYNTPYVEPVKIDDRDIITESLSFETDTDGGIILPGAPL